MSVQTISIVPYPSKIVGGIVRAKVGRIVHLIVTVSAALGMVLWAAAQTAVAQTESKLSNDPTTSVATDGCPTFPIDVGSTAELNHALTCYNVSSAGSYAISVTQDITLITVTVPITNPVATSLQINGNGQTIDGADAHRIFTVLDGDVTINSLTMQRGRDTNHTCNGNTTNCGGAIYIGNRAAVTVTASLLQNNRVGGDGGAIYSTSSLTVHDSMFISNTATTGGAIWVSSNPPTISGSTFYDNRAVNGGAFLLGFNIPALIVNSTFSGNSATNAGGAIYLPTLTGQVDIRYSTLISNSAASGGAIHLNTSTLAIASSIMAHNSGGDCDNVNGTLTVGTDSFASDSTCDNATQSSNLSMGPLQDNGGPSTSSGQATWTHALLLGNDAIDAGDDAVCAAAPINNLDQRGFSRPEGAKCDSGAVEGAVCPGFPMDAGTTAELNTAIGCYNDAPAGNYDINITQDITLITATVPITNLLDARLRINGNGHLIDGATSYRHFTVLSGDVNVGDVTLQHGDAAHDCTKTKSFPNCGGAIRVGTAAATVTLSNTNVVSNTASLGGGLFNEGGVLIINSSVISGNVTNYRAGGIGSFAGGTLTIHNSTVAYNQSDTGGGIISTDDGYLFIDQSTIAYNVARSGAGGLESESGLTTVSNSTFSGNLVTDGSIGAIDNTGTLTLTNSTIAYNSASTSAGGLSSRLDSSDGETLTVRNTLFAHNVAQVLTTPFSSRDCASFDENGPAGDIDASNLVGNGTCGSAIESEHLYLGPLQNNGPSTSSGHAPWTHAILPYSEAFNAGDNSVCSAAPINGVDQRGVVRPGYGTCDVGAFELGEISEPIFTSPPTIDFWENQPNLIDVNVFDDIDAEGSGLTLSFGGTDIGLFNADTATGVVTFINVPDYENPSDAGGDNIYNIQITVTDSDGLSAVQDLVITVLDVPECVPFPLGVSTTAELNAAIDCYNYLPGGNHVINVVQDITLVTTTTAVSRAGFYKNDPTSLRINGNGHTMDGVNSYRIFDIVDSHVTLADFTLQNGRANAICLESATCGGAIRVRASGTVTVTASAVVSNTAQVGGGLYNEGVLHVTSSTIYSNSALLAGGIGSQGAITVSNSTLSFNSATDGAGLVGLEGRITVRNSTLYGNAAANSLGGFFSTDSTSTVRNSIIAENLANGLPSGCFNADGAMINATNLDTDGTCGDAVQSASINLGPLQDNAGSTWTHALLNSSSARGAGDNAICATAPVNNVDQRGIPRPQFSTCDIGAFEHWVNLAPTVTSSNAVTVSENQTGTIDVNATDDVDVEGAGLLFSLSGGTDAGLFTIDADAGVLTFLSAPDFENPLDADGNNVYNIQVTVSETTFVTNALTAVQEITITVTDVYENVGPTITSGSAVTVAENQASVIDVSTTDDVDSEGAGLTYSLSDGADQALFTIDASTGVVTFLNPPDFENPVDVGSDNVYNIQVTVTDSGTLTDIQDIVISVIDIIENYTLTVTSVGNGAVSPAPGSHVFAVGQTVPVTAMADSGYEFSGWSGDLNRTANPTTITMNDDKVITATFTMLPISPMTPTIPVTPTIELSLEMDAVSPIRVGVGVNFMVMVTNTGDVTITTLPLKSFYPTAYLRFEGATTPPDNPADMGSHTWSNVLTNVLTTGAQALAGQQTNRRNLLDTSFAPGAAFSITLTYTALRDTTQLPNNQATLQIESLNGAQGRADISIFATTAMTLNDKSVQLANEIVMVNWTTSDESTIIGFHIWREDANGQRVQVTETPISAQQSGLSNGADYLWTESASRLGETIHYSVEILGQSGDSQFEDIGSLSLAGDEQNAIFLPMIANSGL
ncbi:MAG: choice-of-anchor Q domain-containing protein [Chloroflexota bacterium]